MRQGTQKRANKSQPRQETSCAESYTHTAQACHRWRAAAAVIARTRLQRLPVFNSLHIMFSSNFVQNMIFITFYCGLSVGGGCVNTTTGARERTHTITRWCRLRFDSAFRLPPRRRLFFWPLSSTYLTGCFLPCVRFDNNLILIVIHMQLAATIKQIINNQPADPAPSSTVMNLFFFTITHAAHTSEKLNSKNQKSTTTN